MKLSREWLEEYTHIQASDKDYCDAMTMSGSKVEGYEVLAEDITNVVVGRVDEIVRHTNSDHMWVCQVDVGGRNSLDFTPTLLDYLDVSAPNCFMGESLFLDPNPVEAPEEGLVPMDMVYFDGMDVSTTSGSDIDVIDEDADEYDLYMEEIMDYVAVSRVPLEA